MAYYGNNSLDPQAPEWNQPWKSEFNHGCCTSCGQQTVPVCTTVTSRFTRTDRSDDLVTSVDNNYYCPCGNAIKPTENC